MVRKNIDLVDINLLLIPFHAGHFPNLLLFFQQKSTLKRGDAINLPTKRQCFSILLDKATFSPTSVQAGEVNWIFAKSALTLTTLPPVEVDPILMRSSSFLTSLVTFVCFLSSVLTPRRRRRRKRDISSSRSREFGLRG